MAFGVRQPPLTHGTIHHIDACTKRGEGLRQPADAGDLFFVRVLGLTLSYEEVTG